MFVCVLSSNCFLGPNSCCVSSGFRLKHPVPTNRGVGRKDQRGWGCLQTPGGRAAPVPGGGGLRANRPRGQPPWPRSARVPLFARGVKAAKGVWLRAPEKRYIRILPPFETCGEFTYQHGHFVFRVRQSHVDLITFLSPQSFGCGSKKQKFQNGKPLVSENMDQNLRFAPCRILSRDPYMKNT